MARGSRWVVPFVAACIAGGAAAPAASAAWVGAWGASLQPYPYGFRPEDPIDYFTAQSGRPVDQTLRLIVHPAIAGSSVRIRLSNAFGDRPLVIGAATIARREQAGALKAETVTPVTFAGQRGVTVPAGADVTSDAAPLAVAGGEDLAVSLAVAGTAPRPSWHPLALVTSYVSSPGSGDLTGAADGAGFARHLHTLLWLTGVEVDAPDGAGAIVALGDSITDGDGSTFDGRDRYVDHLARRLAALRDRPPLAVVNAGISGNTAGTAVCTGSAVATCAPPMIERLDRDVLGIAGVRSVLLLAGSNDIALGASTDVVKDALRELAARIRGAGLRVVGATIIPRDAPPWYSPSMDRVRNAVNGWIRAGGGGSFDAVVDFDAVMRAGPGVDSLASDKTDDDVHPNRKGHKAMGEAVDLELFGSVTSGVAVEPSVRATKRRAVVVKLRCAPWVASSCRGDATLTSKGRTLGSASYRVDPGAAGRVRIMVRGLRKRTALMTVRLVGDPAGAVDAVVRVVR